MKDRHANERQSISQDIELLGRNPSDTRLDASLKQLEDCVKNGLIYQACELSDWISFIVSDKLEKLDNLRKQKNNTPLGQMVRRLRIERLKRLGYLHFFEQEKICRDELCESEDLAFHLMGEPSDDYDHTRLTLYTAIGHTLWHENELEEFKKNFESYNTLFNLLTDGCGLKTEMHAFLVAMEGRKAYLEKQGVEKVMGQFDSALNILGPERMSTRGGLHIINYYLDHLNAMYADVGFESAFITLSQRMEELFVVFDRCRIGLPKGKALLEPIKTLLQIHFGVHRLRKMNRDLVIRKSPRDIKLEIDAVSRDLMFTAVMLGLGSLNPCPPLLRDVYDYAGMQQGLFDLNQAKEQLKRRLIDLDPLSFEDIAQIYFEHMRYKVDRLPAGTDTFDLLVHVENGIGLISTMGVQVKRIHDNLPTKEFREWRSTAMDYARANEIAHVLFFLESNPSRSINRTKSNFQKVFPHIQADIEFWNINAITERLWQQSGCLPRVYAVIENSIRAKHHNEPVHD